MDLHQLRTLKHVAELGSLSRAADRLRIAQPALSRQIRLLEEELGTALFERHGRGMVITETGREVLKHALRIMAEVEELRAKVDEAAGPLSGRVVLGMPPTISEIITVPLVRAFDVRHPEVELSFVSAFSGYLLDWQQRGELDLAVLYDPQTTRSLRTRPLLLESFYLFGPSDAGFQQHQPLRFAELAGRPLVLPGPRHAMRSIFQRCAAEAGIQLKVRIEVDSLSAMKDLVRSGYGQTLLPLACMHDDIVAGQLTAAPLIDPTPTRRMALSFPADRPASRAAQFAAAEIARIVSERVAGGTWSGEIVSAP
ncbi:MAG: LysR substrate-binding domain-containing protein [Parvibaculaceae bacterium]